MLFKALAVFSLRGINLSKVIVTKCSSLSYIVMQGDSDCYVASWSNFQIESRPQKRRPLRVVDDSNKGSAK